MVYDPAWEMPRVNWQPQGSFEVGAIPPTSEPDAEPLVCLPAINQDWLPFVLGCLDQLINPSTWLTGSELALYLALARSIRLKQMIGGRADCMTCTLVRLQSCQLQTSCDDGATWTTATGWDPGWFECIQEAIPVIGLPPNPGDQPGAQLACSIAAYLADDVILKSITQAITSITDDIALLGFGGVILNIIPEFVLVRLAFDALYIVYTQIQGGTISDYEAARDDPTLWHEVQCAIYNCIVADGFVKPSNFACIVAGIAAIPYAHSDVIDTIVAFVTSLGAVGLAQLSQRAGLLIGADCSDCTPGWCLTWDFSTGNLGWATDGGGTNLGIWSSGKWFGSDGGGSYNALDIVKDMTGPVFCTSFEVTGVFPAPAFGGVPAFVETGGPTTYLLPTTTGPTTLSVAVNANIQHLRYVDYGSLGADNEVSRITIRGTGVAPVTDGGAYC
jgi:hypothetical protein